ncbi:MAG TPA: noncanonical pyrimidine nucleotidase, YjjG family [Bacteroidales bacterium]|jgi:putative hydrolase of the HAD superfamily|nr:noncanonical pyrimidine nucleotidase, YjjG family [Bacteroidales bacterium]
MRKYEHIFFDLDRTLWNFDANSSATLLELIDHFKLSKVIADRHKWLSSYVRHNIRVWSLYENRQISKPDLRLERFRLLLSDFNIQDESLVMALSDYYLANAPLKPALMPYAKEILDYLNNKYKLYILSNGFYETQIQKLKSGGILAYFNKIFTSDTLHVAKPQRKIYQEALKSVNARKDKSVFIGDNLENDVIGPGKFGMDQIWYNHDGIISEVEATYQIKSLEEIKGIL